MIDLLLTRRQPAAETKPINSRTVVQPVVLRSIFRVRRAVVVVVVVVVWWSSVDVTQF